MASRSLLRKVDNCYIYGTNLEDSGTTEWKPYWWLKTAADRKSTRLNSSPPYDLVCRLLLEKKKKNSQKSLPSIISLCFPSTISLISLTHYPHPVYFSFSCVHISDYAAHLPTT